MQVIDRSLESRKRKHVEWIILKKCESYYIDTQGDGYSYFWDDFSI